jgi:ketol-acid reductoisomerase
VGAFGVVEGEIARDAGARLEDGGVRVQVDLFVLDRAPEPLDEDGVAPATAAAAAEIVMLFVPDTAQAAVYGASLRDALTPGKTLMFAHGFNVHYGFIAAEAGVDVSMVAPKSPGHRVRELFTQGAGTPALVAVAQDASGHAFSDALAYARAIGCTRAGVIETTFREETETDLFGEQAVLCGGVSHLVKAGFETLVEAGYQPELAYFECLHELKLIVDLMYQGGLNFMRYSVSDTAEYGDYVAGPRVITDETRATMRALLARIRDGSFAREWVSENANGRPWFEKARLADMSHPIEQVGATLRAMMPFVQPRVVEPGAGGA